ncbi:MAG: hypothetical protein KAR54_02840 [Candidatus Pacebacteria bacterium]|nr:hypothetical protein [Candidatus Paceibacterota bacterium]
MMTFLISTTILSLMVIITMILFKNHNFEKWERLMKSNAFQKSDRYLGKFPSFLKKKKQDILPLLLESVKIFLYKMLKLFVRVEMIATKFVQKVSKEMKKMYRKIEKDLSQFK